MQCFAKCCQDEFHPVHNKNGMINLGTAVNALCEDLIEERLKKVKMIFYLCSETVHVFSDFCVTFFPG